MNVRDICCECGIPSHMHEGIVGYVNDGWMPGDFLKGVLAGDLQSALGRADHINSQSLPSYAKLLSRLPMGCHGSYEIVDAWVARGGLGTAPNEAGNADAEHVIYCFNNGGSPGWMSAVALGDDGVAITGHTCSSEGYMRHDLGITSDWKHKEYNAHFGEGNWRLEWVDRDQFDTHEGFKAAMTKNAERITAEATA